MTRQMPTTNAMTALMNRFRMRAVPQCRDSAGEGTCKQAVRRAIDRKVKDFDRRSDDVVGQGPVRFDSKGAERTELSSRVSAEYLTDRRGRRDPLRHADAPAEVVDDRSRR